MKQNLKALVVEDDPISRKVIVQTLSAMNITNATSENGVEALKILNTRDFDFILMDINMPEQDGLDTVRWIRDLEDAYFKSLPIFALTAFGSGEHTLEILGAGMNEHLTKPIDPATLEAVLNKYF